jgi:hypothetical protein
MVSLMALLRAMGQLTYGNHKPKVVCGSKAKAALLKIVPPAERERASVEFEVSPDVADDSFLITPTTPATCTHPVTGKLVNIEPVTITLAEMEIPATTMIQ